MTEEVLPITSLDEGVECSVVSIDAGVNATQRLTEMGLTPGTSITITRKTHYGPVEICVRGSRLVIGRGIAKKVYVSVI